MENHVDLYELHIGVDDLDTFGWGCTTYYIYSLLKEIKRSSMASRLRFLDYPLLTRLNPAIPLRTRGNGALSIHVAGEENDLIEVVEIATSLLDSRAMPGREPGVISLIGRMPLTIARKIYIDLLTDIAEISYIERVIEKIGGRIHIAGKGVIGALGSISHYYIEGDCTYEIIAYSDNVENVYIDPERLARMDVETRPLTFNNIDPETGKPLIKPSTGAPVALGIRGESPEILVKAFNILKPENISGYSVFRTNQATDQHLIPRSIADAKFYRTGLFRGRVIDPPRVLRGGDVILRISDGSSEIDVAIYREAGEANKVARSLVPGDLIAVGGSVKPWIKDDGESPVINVEYLKVLRLSDQYIEMPPRCPRCGSSMESMGRGKGYRCRRCGYRDPRASKIAVKLDRRISEGIYKPPPRNMKHLTKPLSRIGLEKVCKHLPPRDLLIL
ncbi:MAG: tRNA(Ile)(2)-agmatinylcytidine synthase [Sulfolobales archaeon]